MPMTRWLEAPPALEPSCALESLQLILYRLQYFFHSSLRSELDYIVALDRMVAPMSC